MQDDKRAKSHAFTIDMSASADGAGGARKIVGGGSSASSGLKVSSSESHQSIFVSLGYNFNV